MSSLISDAVAIVIVHPLIEFNIKRSVSCTSNRHPIPGDHAPAVTMIGWHGTALGCRRPHLQLNGNSKWRRRLSD